MSAQTYQVGAHFAALIKGILMAPLKTIERVFCISSSPAGLCSITKNSNEVLTEPTEQEVTAKEGGIRGFSSIPKLSFPENLET